MPVARPFPLQQIATIDDQSNNHQMIEIMTSDEDVDPSIYQVNSDAAVRCYTELTPAIDEPSADYLLDDFDYQPLGPAFVGDSLILSQSLVDGNFLHRNPLISDEFLNSCCTGQHQMECEKHLIPVTICQEEAVPVVKNQNIGYNAVGGCSTTHLPSIRCFINGQTNSCKLTPSAIRRNVFNASTSSTNNSLVFDLLTQSMTTVDQSSSASLDCFLNDLDAVLGPSIHPDGSMMTAADVLYTPSSRQFDMLENVTPLISDLSTWHSSLPLSPSADSDSDSAISVTSGIGDFTDFNLPCFTRQATVHVSDWEPPSGFYGVPRRIPAKMKKTRMDCDSSSMMSPASSPDACGEDSGWPPSPQQLPRRRREKSRTPHLWKFMRTLLEDPSYNPEFIKWENKSEGVFRIVPGKSKHIASLWGLKKNNPSMTFDKLSRSLRWCRKYGFLADLPKSDRYPKKLCFRFARCALNWVPDQSVTIPSLDAKAAA